MIERWRNEVLLAYADESGDSGDLALKGASLTYTVGCVMVDADDWPLAFNGLLNFRRRIAAAYKVPVRAELKSSYLIGGSGTLRGLGLSTSQRSLIFRAHLRVMASLKLRAFAVVVDKRSPTLPDAPDALAWQTVIERLERTSYYEKTSFALVHDNGDNLLIRKTARKARRRITAGSAYGSGSLTLAASRFVDDPVPRDSAQSYLVQLADLTAYAGFRTLIPPGESVARVVPVDMWQELGKATHAKVNSISGGTPGVVVRIK